MNNSTLTRAIQVIGILFSAFGGFLTGLAPPEEANAKFAVGISSFAALVILLLCAALSQKKPTNRHKRIWIASAIAGLSAFFAFAYLYQTARDRFVFEYPPGAIGTTYIAGDEFTDDAKAYLSKNPHLSNAQLLAKFGGLENREMVWTKAGIDRTRTRLIWTYVLTVLTLSFSIFSLTERFLGGNLQNPAPAPKDVPAD